MIEVREIDGNLMVAEAAGVIEEDQLMPLEAQLENQLKLFETVKLLIDGRNLTADIDSVRTQFGFIQKYHQGIEKLALVASETWLQWAGTIADAAVDGQIGVFDDAQMEEAENWVRS